MIPITKVEKNLNRRSRYFATGAFASGVILGVRAGFKIDS